MRGPALVVVVVVVVVLALASGCDLIFAPGKGPGAASDAPIPDDGVVLTTDAFQGDGPEFPDAGVDGSISVDTDADGVPDSTDNCVMTPNPLQYNKDDDLLGDVCDPCPHLHGSTGADLDLDGDGLGNGCDPRISSPGDTAEFYGFYNPGVIDTWTQQPGGQWIVQSGRVVNVNNSTPYARLIAPVTGANTVVTIGAQSLDQIAGNSDHFVGVIAGSAGGSHEYECRAAQPTGTFDPSLRLRQQIDDTESISETAWPSGQLIGRTIQLQISLADDQMTCSVRTEPSGDPQAAFGASISALHDGYVGFESHLIQIQVDFMFIARMP
jgi:hypothetical protein